MYNAFCCFMYSSYDCCLLPTVNLEIFTRASFLRNFAYPREMVKSLGRLLI